MSNLINKCAIEEFKAAIESDGDCQVVDVREHSEFEAERISGAKLIPLSSFDRQASAIDRDRPVYLICRSGNRASKAAEKLHKLGYSDVRVVEGGMQAWIAAGHPIERGGGRVWSLERQVRFVAGLIVLTGVLLAWFVNPGFIWLAGFIGAGLTFAAITDTCAMGMLLARMPWNQKPKGTSQNCAPSRA
jgi:rhodanese-related sulfurtransferase